MRSADNSEAWIFMQVWGCISANENGDLIRIHRQDPCRGTYLSSHNTIGDMISPSFTLLRDNDPKHTLKVIKNHLQSKEEQEVLEVVTWLPHSPDLNITESV